jgi:putative MATE family efflux protein
MICEVTTRDTEPGDGAVARTTQRLPTGTGPPETARTDARAILGLALPTLGALIAEPLFLLADSAIVGHLGADRLAGLGTAAAALNTLVNVCVFLAFGTTARVARLLGAGDRQGAFARGIDGIYLALALGLLLAAVGAVFAPQIVHLLGATAQAQPYATTYLRISSLGLPGMLAVLAATGLLRGLQDMKTPLAVAATAAVVNTALNWVLVYPAGLGVGGSAFGTVLVQYAMAAVYLATVARAARAERVSLRPDPAAVRSSLGANTALLLRTVALRVYLLVAVWTAGSFGTVALAAHTIATNLWVFLAFALDALAMVAQTLVGHDLGAGRMAAARATAGRMVRWGIGFGLVTGLGLFVLHPVYLPLFTSDHAVRAALPPVLAVEALFQPAAGAVFVLDGVLIGAGDSVFLAWASVACTGVFLAGVGVIHVLGGGLTALWVVVGVFTLARWMMLGLRARSDGWLRAGPAR